MKVLFINVEKPDFWTEDLDFQGIIDLGIHLHLERYKSYKYPVYHKNNVIIFGAGSLKYPGSYRCTIVFRSPLHGGLHSSTLGGFGEYIRRAGYNAIVIEGKAKKPSFIVIKNKEVVIFEEKIPENVFEKTEKLKESLKEYYGKTPFRIALVGVASYTTSFGAIVSEHDFAGRGGGGSVLLRAHNIVGLAVGGDQKKIEYEIPKGVDIIGATKKYREKGTFLGNYEHYGSSLPMYNWQNILKGVDLTNKIRKLLEGYKPISGTCGERCPAACKKYEKKIKIDYEPANGLGSFIGIFDREKVIWNIYTGDSYGFDAIYLGHVLAGILEKEEILDINRETEYDVRELIKKIAYGDIEIENVRSSDFRDHVTYLVFGEKYDMTPNYYHSLGFFLPTAIPGTYLTDYSKKVTYESVYQRMIREYQLNNLGVCRFHRKWLEPLLDYSKVEESLRLLYEYRKEAKAEPRFYESEKTLEVVKTFGDPEELFNGWLDFLEKKNIIV